MEDIIRALPEPPDLSDKLALMEEKMGAKLTAVMEAKWATMGDALSLSESPASCRPISPRRRMPFTPASKTRKAPTPISACSAKSSELLVSTMDLITKLGKVKGMYSTIQQGGGLKGAMSQGNGGIQPGYSPGAQVTNERGTWILGQNLQWVLVTPTRPVPRNYGPGCCSYRELTSRTTSRAQEGMSDKVPCPFCRRRMNLKNIPRHVRKTRTPEAPGVRKTSRTRSRSMVMHGTTVWTWKTRLAKSTSILTALFAVTPALFILTNTPSGASGSPLGNLLGGGGNWQSIQDAGWALAQNVIQNWVAILIILAVVYVAIKVVRKMGHGARITRHLRA